MRRTIVFSAALITLASGVARAAEPTTAEDFIVRGLELRRAAKPGEALEMFQRAHALAPSPRTLGQMGLVEASLEHWLDAETHLTAAMASPGDAWVTKNRAFLDQALVVTRGHIGELTVTGPAATDVSVDGKHVGTLPALPPQRLVEGNVVVTANSAGFKDFSKTVTIAGGAKVAVAIVLDPSDQRASVAVAAPVPLPAPPPGTTTFAPSAEQPARGWRTPTGVGLVAAGAGLAAWGIIWIAVDANDNCPMRGPACNSVYDTKTTGWMLTAGGVAAAGVGAALLVLGHRNGNANVALDLTPTSLSLRGRF
ncbi:MAG TPA: hypothetical protein VN903_16025 [Polyangia bacterium]|nr:hypothetical protein [Polyangia bacterium]